MSLRNAPAMWLSCAVALGLASVPDVARAADSLPDALTNAFETIVIDATKAASKATKAAQDALAAEERKSKRKSTARKDNKPEPDAAEKAEETSKSTKQADKAATKPEKSGADKTSDKAPAGKGAPAEPAAKAADGKPADPKADKKTETAKKTGSPTEWPAVEVELAKARCTQLLKGVDAVTIPEAPFRKGDCGTMAPVRLISIGKEPEVSFSPPPVVTCDLVVALTKWVKDEVQPAAKRHLGSEVIRIESMSDYSCRMAYGRVGNKLSEHGKANALDIRSFTTRKGEQAVVLSDWGQTRRDVLKQIVAARAAEKAAAEKAAAEAAKKETAKTADGKDTETVSKLPRKTLAEGLAKDGKRALAVPASVTKDEDLSPKPSSLGGPKDAVLTKEERKERKGARKRRSKEEAALLAALPAEEAAKVKAPAPRTRTARFLRDIHGSACRIFGTTLGPEANEAHRNHFHVDMAERKFRKICD